MPNWFNQLQQLSQMIFYLDLFYFNYFESVNYYIAVVCTACFKSFAAKTKEGSFDSFIPFTECIAFVTADNLKLHTFVLEPSLGLIH